MLWLLKNDQTKKWKNVIDDTTIILFPVPVWHYTIVTLGKQAKRETIEVKMYEGRTV
jgi:hypothetical protein